MVDLGLLWHMEPEIWTHHLLLYILLVSHSHTERKPTAPLRCWGLFPSPLFCLAFSAPNAYVSITLPRPQACLLLVRKGDLCICPLWWRFSSKPMGSPLSHFLCDFVQCNLLSDAFPWEYRTPASPAFPSMPALLCCPLWCPYLMVLPLSLLPWSYASPTAASEQQPFVVSTQRIYLEQMWDFNVKASCLVCMKTNSWAFSG